MTVEDNHVSKRAELEIAVSRALALADELGLSDVGIQLDGALTRLCPVVLNVVDESHAVH